MLKVAIIAIAKSEERYIKEWLDYHLALGFDTIIVGDNDDELVLSGYASQQVIIEDYTRVEGVQTKAYTELFEKYRNDFDWILFIDIDEFIVFEQGNVKDFLSRFPEEDIVRINMKHFTDNEELDVIDDNYNVFDRFKTPISVDDDRFVKSFIRGSIKCEIDKIYGHGIYSSKLRAVDALGNECGTICQKIKYVVHEVCWLNHYRTKTIGEYIRQKYHRGGANRNPNRYDNWQRYFFRTNTLTEDKVNYAESLIEKMSSTSLSL